MTVVDEGANWRCEIYIDGKHMTVLMPKNADTSDIMNFCDHLKTLATPEAS